MSEPSTTDTPSLTALLVAVQRQAVGGDYMGGWLPGAVQAVHGRLVDVQLLVQDVEELADGTRSVRPFSLLTSVPVAFPGQGGNLIEWTPQAGDTVLVLFGSRSIDRYMQIGGTSPVDPDDTRKCDLSDAIALPVGAFDRVHARSASPQIKFTGSQIQVGGAAALALNADLGTLKSALDTFMTSLATAVGSIPGGTTAGAAVTTAKGVFDTTLLTWAQGTQNLRGG